MKILWTEYENYEENEDYKNYVENEDYEEENP